MDTIKYKHHNIHNTTELCKADFDKSTHKITSLCTMAQNEKLTDRIREALLEVPDVTEKTMFRGITFMVKDKICISVGDKEIMCRIDPAVHEEAITKSGCRTMERNGHAYKGYVYVNEEAIKAKKIWTIG